jgi:hypothetical protein
LDRGESRGIKRNMRKKVEEEIKTEEGGKTLLGRIDDDVS